MAAAAASCIVCVRDYDDAAHLPKMLPCGHSLCLKCVTDLASQPKAAAVCKNWKETGTCMYGDKCRFSHNLQAAEPRLPCRNWATTGTCKFGKVCRFSHGEEAAQPAAAPLTCPYDRKPFELPKEGATKLPTNFAIVETLPQKPRVAVVPAAQVQVQAPAGPPTPSKAPRPAAATGARPKKPPRAAGVDADGKPREKRVAKGTGKKLKPKGAGAYESKAQTEKKAELSDVLKFVNTKPTTKNYNDRYNEPKLKRFHTLTRVGNMTTATAVQNPEYPDNLMVRQMTFDKPELFFCKAGYVPYDPDEMMEVKDGAPVKDVLVRFDPDGAPLRQPLKLPLPRAPTASKMRFQGGALLFFIEYPHSTGVHFSNVLVYQYDETRGDMGEYVMDGDFSLLNNYINCAAVTKKYLIISYWPYDLEAVKQLKENHRQKLAYVRELEAQNQIIAQLQGTVQQQSRELDLLRQAEVQRKQEMQRLRELEEQARQQALANKAEAARAWEQYQASLRARDPIHLYTRVGKKWVLVLDYHQGAFDLQLRGDAVFIEYPENFQHEFEIVATAHRMKKEVNLKGLPVVPREKLCPFF